MSEKLCVVLSQSRGGSPERRKTEEALEAALACEPEVELAVVPPLVDLAEEHPSAAFLRSESSDMVVLSWLYPRAAFWTLSALGVRGKMGQNRLAEGEQGESGHPQAAAARSSKTSIPGEVPDRFLYPLDLRSADGVGPVVREVQRIAGECCSRRRGSEPVPQRALPGGLQPVRSTEGGGSPGAGILQPAEPRWYPVIDYGRCSNCLECIDFCLFGVYGLDNEARIYVESPESCKTGCPACSRVCPESAILFPEHKDPAIAGSDAATVPAGKMDLSALFGGPDAFEAAAKERLDALAKDGRAPSGALGATGKRRAARRAGTPRDELDELMDALEETDI